MFHSEFDLCQNVFLLLLLPLLFQNATVLKKVLLASDVMKMENVSVRNHITLETNVTNV